MAINSKFMLILWIKSDYKCDGLGTARFNIPFDSRHIIGHFGDDLTGHMTQPRVQKNRFLKNQPGEFFVVSFYFNVQC